tara:strand:- start:1380 stop:1961 length:582 start_codon:yes stop_codon:yes gene_type:complete
MSHDLQIACWFDAIRNNHHEAITTLHRLFNLDINDNTSYEDYFARPIHIAVETDNEDTIRLIVSLGCDVNSTDYYGVTPLYKAVDHNAMTSIKVLLELGADLYANVHRGKLPDGSNEYLTPLELIKLNNDNKVHDFVVPYTKEHKRLKRLQIYARVIGKMMKQYRRSVDNVWKPDGVGYHIARMDFEQNIISI